MKNTSLSRILASAVVLVMAASCNTHKGVVVRQASSAKTLLATTDKGWLRYKIYRLPTTDTLPQHVKINQPLLLSIMIVNIADGTSPLRKICGSLDQYNTTYEYLLNQVKGDLALVTGTAVLYPTYYSFENNYNAFPFETLNVGFSAEALAGYKINKSLPIRLLYVDKVFAHDTLTCDITPAI